MGAAVDAVRSRSPASYAEGGERHKGSLEPTPMVMVGFNRRFAPHVVKMKELLRTVPEPKAFVMLADPVGKRS